MSGGSDNENAVELKVCDGTVCKAAVEVHPRQGCNHLFVYTLTGKPIAPRVFVAGVEDGCDGDHVEKFTVVSHVTPQQARDHVLVLPGYTVHNTGAVAQDDGGGGDDDGDDDGDGEDGAKMKEREGEAGKGSKGEEGTAAFNQADDVVPPGAPVLVTARMTAGVRSFGMLVPEATSRVTAPKPYVGGNEEFVPWPKIPHLDTLAYNFRKVSHTFDVTYRAKVKLHGTNAGIHVLPDGRVSTQSRSRLLTLKKDNAGFAAWVQERQHVFARLNTATRPGVLAEAVAAAKRGGGGGGVVHTYVPVVFGEYCGKKIQGGDAITKLKKRVFCVFGVALVPATFTPATQKQQQQQQEKEEQEKEKEEQKREKEKEEKKEVKHQQHNGGGGGGGGGVWTINYNGPRRLLTEPHEIAAFLQPVLADLCEDVHVLPWHGDPFSLTFGGGGGGHEGQQQEQLQQQQQGDDTNAANIAALNAVVTAIGETDPWVRDTFGVEGPGEGVVACPVRVGGATTCMHMHNYSQLTFKAKAKDHMVKVRSKPAQMNVAVAATVSEFVATTAVTPARCAQGAEAVAGEPRERQLGLFLEWIGRDIREECAGEMEVAGLVWKQVRKQVQAAAKQWFSQHS